MKQNGEKTDRRIAYTILTSVIAVLLLLGFFRFFNLENEVFQFLEWVRSAGYIGFTLFFLAVSITVVFILPSVLFTLAAGYLYGVLGGALAIVLAETLGAYIAFWIARRWQSHNIFDAIKNRKTFKRIGDSLSTQGWSLIALTRMIPFFPFKLSNYFFGMTDVSGRQYVIGTLVGLWPLTLFNVYLGSLAVDLMSVGSSGFQRTPMQWLVVIVGFCVAILVLMKLSRTASRKLDIK